MKNYNIGSIVKHPTLGTGAIVDCSDSSYRIFFNELEITDISIDFKGLQLVNSGPTPKLDDEIDTLKDAIKEVLLEWSDIGPKMELGAKWERGTLQFNPLDSSVQGHEIPIKTFFHKIVMARDRMRVLEQNINSNTTLSDEEKVNLQQYITKIYGSFTSFNFLFKNKTDYFVGESSKK